MKRMERYWRTYGRRRSSFSEKAFIKWKMRRFANEGTERFQWVMKEGWRRMQQPGINADLAQLLYYYDSAHFCDYLDQFRSESWEHNVEIIAEPYALDLKDMLNKKQWEQRRLKKQSGSEAVA